MGATLAGPNTANDIRAKTPITRQSTSAEIHGREAKYGPMATADAESACASAWREVDIDSPDRAPVAITLILRPSPTHWQTFDLAEDRPSGDEREP
jgi:hypothetical protein